MGTASMTASMTAYMTASMTARATASLLAAIALGGCDDPEFDSRVELSGYRVIGIEADPPQVAPDGSLTLRAHDFDDAGEAVEYAWSVCLVDPGAQANAPCPHAELSVVLDATRELSVDLGPDGLDLEGRLSASGPQFTPSGAPASPQTGFDIVVTLDSGADCDGCRQVRTVKRVRVLADPSATPSNNPRILSFDVEGTARAGETVTLRAEADSPEDYRDPLDDTATTESYLYTWYSALGETDPGLTFDEKRETQLELPDDAQPGTEFEVIVALRDSRRGLAVERQTVTVEP